MAYARQAAAAGIEASTDQQLAGLYIWNPAGMVLTVIGLAVVFAWMAEGERRARADDGSTCSGMALTQRRRAARVASGGASVAITRGVADLFEWPVWAGYALVGVLLGVAGAVLSVIVWQQMQEVAVLPKSKQTLSEHVQWLGARVAPPRVETES